MGVAVDILKANHIGIRDLKKHLSARFLDKVLVITDRGIPVSVTLPYSDVLELLDILDEFTDAETIETICEARKEIKKGGGGIPVAHLFGRIKERVNEI